MIYEGPSTHTMGTSVKATEIEFLRYFYDAAGGLFWSGR